MILYVSIYQALILFCVLVVERRGLGALNEYVEESWCVKIEFNQLLCFHEKQDAQCWYASINYSLN